MMQYLHKLCANAQDLDSSQRAQGIIQALQLFPCPNSSLTQDGQAMIRVEDIVNCVTV